MGNCKMRIIGSLKVCVFIGIICLLAANNISSGESQQEIYEKRKQSELQYGLDEELKKVKQRALTKAEDLDESLRDEFVSQIMKVYHVFTKKRGPHGVKHRYEPLLAGYEAADAAIRLIEKAFQKDVQRLDKYKQRIQKGLETGKIVKTVDGYEVEPITKRFYKADRHRGLRAFFRKGIQERIIIVRKQTNLDANIIEYKATNEKGRIMLATMEVPPPSKEIPREDRIQLAMDFTKCIDASLLRPRLFEYYLLYKSSTYFTTDDDKRAYSACMADGWIEALLKQKQGVSSRFLMSVDSRLRTECRKCVQGKKVKSTTNSKSITSYPSASTTSKTKHQSNKQNENYDTQTVKDESEEIDIAKEIDKTIDSTVKGVGKKLKGLFSRKKKK